MKITNIRIFQIDIDVSSWLLMTVETDAGITGWGDVSDSLHDGGVADILQNIVKPYVMGKNPLNIMECEAVIAKWRYPVVNNIRQFAIAKSGLDQALWDVTAKYYEIPLYKMYGATGKKDVELYANLNNAIKKDRTPLALYNQGVSAKEQGFKIVKCTPFDEVNPDNVDCDFTKGLERLKALTEVWPIEKIAIDCHQRFGRYELGTMVDKILNDFGKPYWIEDPVPVLDYETMNKMTIRYPEIRWVAGEDSFMPVDIMRTVCSGCYDIIMPDVKFIGGPSAVKGLVSAIDGMGKKMTIHNPSGIISTAHSAHLTALCGGLPLEFPLGAVKNRAALGIPNENIVDGRYVFNDDGGIGISISDEALKEYAMEFVNSKWIKY